MLSSQSFGVAKPSSAAPLLMIYHLPSGLLSRSLPGSVHQSAALPSFQGGRAEGFLAFLSPGSLNPTLGTTPSSCRGILYLITNPTSSSYLLTPPTPIRAISGTICSTVSSPRIHRPGLPHSAPAQGRPSSPSVVLSNQVLPVALSLQAAWRIRLHMNKQYSLGSESLE